MHVYTCMRTRKRVFDSYQCPHMCYSRAAYTTRCSFYSVIVFADVETCCFVCTNEGLVDTSIGVLQLLQMLADGSRYQSTSICEASRACNKLQGEIVATPGWEAVGKAHPRHMKPIEDHGNKLWQYVKPEKTALVNCSGM